MYELEVFRSFSAAHQLKGYNGDCAKLHGHNWQVAIVMQVKELDNVGIGVDFKVLKRELDRILDEFDHSNLSELECVKTMNPTSENIARLIYKKLAESMNDGNVKVAKVKISESPNSTAAYYE